MKHLIILIYASILGIYRKILMFSDSSMNLIFIPGFSKLRTFNGIARAYAEFIKAKRRVPAYKEFLKSHHFTRPGFNGFVPNLYEIPYTEKENYVKLYSMDERCVNGKVPTKNVIIDESSGSSGTATNWARGKVERETNARFIKFGIHRLFGNEPLFVINAFALGPWATGVNITMSCVRFSKLKSLGPDKTKIENTIKQFGKTHKYLVMGYPPFLKMLVDNSNINWLEFNVSFIFGGESMSEGMRDYLKSKGIKRIISSLGASDLELNLSAENDFTISLRQLLRSNPDLAKRVLKHPGALPMVFQYNSSDFLFETSSTGELIVTVCRPGYISPKIRYNIHDRGHVLQMKELKIILKELNIDINSLSPATTDLPLLFHYGRADASVSFFGANISPEDLREVIYTLPDLASITNSFCLSVNESEQGDKQLEVGIELQQDKNYYGLHQNQTRETFFDQLARINQDFREARKMLTHPDQLQLVYHKNACGPFEKNDIRIKAKYIH